MIIDWITYLSGELRENQEPIQADAKFNRYLNRLATECNAIWRKLFEVDPETLNSNYFHKFNSKYQFSFCCIFIFCILNSVWAKKNLRKFFFFLRSKLRWMILLLDRYDFVVVQFYCNQKLESNSPHHLKGRPKWTLTKFEYFEHNFNGQEVNQIYWKRLKIFAIIFCC